MGETLLVSIVTCCFQISIETCLTFWRALLTKQSRCGSVGRPMYWPALYPRLVMLGKDQAKQNSYCSNLLHTKWQVRLLVSLGFCIFAWKSSSPFEKLVQSAIHLLFIFQAGCWLLKQDIFQNVLFNVTGRIDKLPTKAKKSITSGRLDRISKRLLKKENRPDCGGKRRPPSM